MSSIGTKVNLLGSNAQEAAIVDQWVQFAEHEISVPSYNIMGLIYGFSKPFSLEVRTIRSPLVGGQFCLKHLDS